MLRCPGLLLSIVCLIGSTACGDDSSAEPDGGRVDATTAPDAAASDAAPSDAAPSDAAPPQTASLMIQDVDGAPVQGVVVVFHDATGAVTTTVTTDAEGLASATIEANAMITAIRPGVEAIFSDVDAYTFTGVNPGDTLTLGTRAPAPAMPTTTITVTSPVINGGLTPPVIENGCDSAAPAFMEDSAILDVADGCLDEDGKVDLLLYVYSDVLVPGFYPPVLQYSVLEAVQPDPERSVEVVMPALTAFTSEDDQQGLSLLNPREGLSSIRGRHYNLKGNRRYFAASLSEIVPPEGLDVIFFMPANFFDSRALEIKASNNGGASLINLERFAAGDLVFDLDDKMLPTLDRVALTLPSIERPLVTFESRGDLSVADSFFVGVKWTDTDGEPVRWLILTDADAGNLVRVPELPAGAPFDAIRPNVDSDFFPAFGVAADSSLADDHTSYMTTRGFRILDDPSPLAIGTVERYARYEEEAF